MFFDEIVNHFNISKRSEGKAWAFSPLRDERTASVILTNAGGQILIHDFGGDQTTDILAAVGLKLSDLYRDQNMTIKQKHTYKKQKSKLALSEIIWHELHVLIQFFDTRFCDAAKAADKNYLAQHPEFKTMPSEPWARELQAQSRLLNALGEYYEQ